MNAVLIRLLAGAGAAALAGCASGGDYAAGETARYAGADRLLPGAPDYPAAEIPIDNPQRFAAATPPPAPSLLADYAGIDGARRAHRQFTEVEAEMLDGGCERFVKIAQGESLADVARLCDVPEATLIGYNPAIAARGAFAGDVIEIPALSARAAAGAAAPSGGILQAGWYVVQPGDTLSTIAEKHLVSAAAVANVNAGVDWRALPPGAKVKLPAPGAFDKAGAAAPPQSGARPVAPPDDERPGAYRDGVSADVSAQMPYRLTPQGAPGGGPRSRPELLTVDRLTALPGSSVTVSARGLKPNAEVSLYRGPNGRDLEFVKTVTTDAEGAFSTPVTVRGSDGLGGVIFKATVEDGDEKLLSPRVGVNTLDSQ